MAEIMAQPRATSHYFKQFMLALDTCMGFLPSLSLTLHCTKGNYHDISVLPLVAHYEKSQH